MADRHSIITLPNKHLRERSKRIGIVSDKVKQLIQDMKDATLDWEDHRQHEFGVALAAVQIDELFRVVIVRTNMEDKDDRSFDVFINPEITKMEGEPEIDYEGCLSIKDVYGKVPRYPKIKLKALDENGKEFRLSTEGFLARVFQHEIDHTNGKLFIDLIKDQDVFYKILDDGKLEKQKLKDVMSKKELWD